MKWLNDVIYFFGGTVFLVRDIYSEIKTRPFYFNILLKQVYEIGWHSLPIVFVLAAASGMVLTIQFGMTLEKFGAKMYSPKILSLSLFREFSPVFTCLILCGKVGARIAAEIGTMKATQQIDALLAMGISPTKRIVIPYFLGGLIAIPLLCVFSSLVSVLYGALIGWSELNLSAWFFLNKVLYTAKMQDLISLCIKAVCFSCFITLTACYFGLNAKKGANSVGRAVTTAVVYSSVLIIVGNIFITQIYWIIAR